MLNSKIVFVSVVPLLVSSPSWANKTFPMAVNSTGSGESSTSAPASGLVSRSGHDATTIKINNSCFGTNLRSVGNPVSPNAIITAKLEIMVGDDAQTITVEYPSTLVTSTGVVGGSVAPMDAAHYSMPGGGSAGIFGNTIVLNTPFKSGASIDNEGKVTVSNGDVYLKSYTFEQTLMGCNMSSSFASFGADPASAPTSCGQYMGKNGPLSANFGGISVSSDKSNIEINVSFPGQNGFCGGFYSPLMVFFDDERPKFDNVSDFPLHGIGKTMWPEAGAPGWFVALDRDGNGMIDQKIELFGDNEGAVNGFEALRKLDSNKDGVIDHRDKDFKKLVLWQDKNGDGISQKEELVPLSKMVTKISLNYKDGIVTPIGRYAEARERAKFWYKKDGKVKTGDIIDIWLSPAQLKLSQVGP